MVRQALILMAVKLVLAFAPPSSERSTNVLPALIAMLWLASAVAAPFDPIPSARMQPGGMRLWFILPNIFTGCGFFARP